MMPLPIIFVWQYCGQNEQTIKSNIFWDFCNNDKFIIFIEYQKYFIIILLLLIDPLFKNSQEFVSYFEM